MQRNAPIGGGGAFSLTSLIRPHILTMKPYSSARDEYSGKEGVFLDANENALGSVTQHNYTRYPDPMQADLKLKMEPIFGVNSAHIFLGNGSDEPIDLLFRAFCRPNIDNVILLPPTYGMYKVSATLNEIEIKNVPLTIDFQLDTKNILGNVNENTKIIFICSPNNPTGNLIDTAAIEVILNSFNGLVVLDQAYADFAENGDFTSRLSEFPNLVILKTFSKAWGMAALRLGMAFASSEIIAVLNKIKPPYNINQVTQNEAIEALNNFETKNNFVEELNLHKAILIQKLMDVQWVEHIFPSDTNFLLVKFKEAEKIFNYLIINKVIVRNRANEINCEGCLRITIGTVEENNRLIDLLGTYLV
jgi:histidinol-phosphate aminotransferase